ncbi:MAG: aminopeptidase P N-terminal domain-containing protein [Phycisphaerae bacterium]|jgi:Xaa-Pro aminopeptidase
MSCDPIPMTAPPDVYQRRREQLGKALHRPIVLFAGEPRARNYATNTYPFRAGSSYLYFGGPAVSGAAWLIEPGGNGRAGCSLVRPVAGVEEAVWIGESASDDRLAAAAGLDVGSLISPDGLEARVSGRSTAYVAPPCIPTMQWAVSLGLDTAADEELLAIIELRLVKDAHELAAMRAAAGISVGAHLAAMRATAPGRTEADVAAAFEAVLVANRCKPSFTANVTLRGEVLHNDAYERTIEPGKLLLIDAGAEEPGGYACDITRTYPSTGEFTPIQRQLYDTVLRAERAGIAACVPGARFRDVHDMAARVICEGLVEAELLRGDPAELAARGAHTLSFTHGLGHLIGLDVHDMEDFGDLAGYARGRTRRTEFGHKFLRLDRDLAPGMTLTVEPGVYFVPAIWEQDSLTGAFSDVVNRAAVDRLLEGAFGGIRIEDTICVQDGEAGPEVLTSDLPSDADVVAAIVKEGA